MEYRYIVG